jgi:hypothetical protein
MIVSLAPPFPQSHAHAYRSANKACTHPSIALSRSQPCLRMAAMAELAPGLDDNDGEGARGHWGGYTYPHPHPEASCAFSRSISRSILVSISIEITGCDSDASSFEIPVRVP